MKIVDVPDEAAYFEVWMRGDDGKSDEMIDWIEVDDLPDAPDKCVIVLPEEFTKRIHRVKNNTMSVYEFLVEVENELPDVTNVGWNTLANWYLGHVDFVPKKEPEFVVEVDHHEYIYASFIGSAIGKKTVEFWKIPQEVTEEEADELVAGLTALNARKVKVE